MTEIIFSYNNFKRKKISDLLARCNLLRRETIFMPLRKYIIGLVDCINLADCWFQHDLQRRQADRKLSRLQMGKLISTVGRIFDIY